MLQGGGGQVRDELGLDVSDRQHSVRRLNTQFYGEIFLEYYYYTSIQKLKIPELSFLRMNLQICKFILFAYSESSIGVW